jgi:hypothetical protein
MRYTVCQSTNSLSKIQIMTRVELLHVSAPQCHLHGVCWNKGIPVQSTSPGTDRPLWYHFNIKYLERTSLQCCDIGIFQPRDTEQCWVSGCIMCLIQRCKRVRCCLSSKNIHIIRAVAYRGGVWGVQPPPPRNFRSFTKSNGIANWGGNV